MMPCIARDSVALAKPAGRGQGGIATCTCVCTTSGWKALYIFLKMKHYLKKKYITDLSNTNQIRYFLYEYFLHEYFLHYAFYHNQVPVWEKTCTLKFRNIHQIRILPFHSLPSRCKPNIPWGKYFISAASSLYSYGIQKFSLLNLHKRCKLPSLVFKRSCFPELAFSGINLQMLLSNIHSTVTYWKKASQMHFSNESISAFAHIHPAFVYKYIWHYESQAWFGTENNAWVFSFNFFSCFFLTNKKAKE